MRKWLLHIFYIAMLGMLAVSCSNVNMDEPLPAKDVQLSFTLAVGENMAGARSTWGEDYTPNTIGDSYDNKINPDELQVLLYTTENEYVGKVENLLCIQRPDNLNVYDFIGDLSASLTGDNRYKIMVFANCGNNVTEQTDLKEMRFQYDTSAIPMWGVITKNLQLVPGQRQDLGTIDLLRAMAKVEVTLTDEVYKNFDLTGVTLNKYNSNGYCLPKEHATANTTGSIKLDECYRIPQDAGYSTNLNLEKIQKENKAYICYVPEIMNEDGSLAMAVTLTDKNGKNINLENNQLYFKEYRNGSIVDDTPYNIIRNHYYQFTITNINNKFQVNTHYTVCKWDEKTADDITFN